MQRQVNDGGGPADQIDDQPLPYNPLRKNFLTRKWSGLELPSLGECSGGTRPIPAEYIPPLATQGGEKPKLTRKHARTTNPTGHKTRNGTKDAPAV